MTKIPPLKRTRSSSFSHQGRRAFQSIYFISRVQTGWYNVTYRPGDSYKVQVCCNIECDSHIYVDLGDGGLTIVYRGE